ncbi:MAG TPA: C39 family peptidase [Vicinamibacterales bacterium]|nr:C39 family peptidase [Vicinamibacterales bacterium]
MSRAELTSRAGGAVLALVLLSGTASAGPNTAEPQKVPHALLDVPYVAQTPELCGGAAVAMVLRYWGQREVFPEDFAPLVVPSERGIPTASLVTAVRARNWQATVVSSDPRDARSQIQIAIDKGQPLIALIEVSPRTYHYVVIAGATEKEIVVHDPARSPFRVLSWEGFERAWAAAGRWMMLVLPPGGDRAASGPERSVAPTITGNANSPLTPCDALVERGVTLALGDDKEAAEEALVGATRVCPAHPAAWRELAGWRFSQSRWAEAQAFALTAVRLAPDDGHARELLATSRYLSGDLLGALDAWSPAGEPRIDVISIHGAERTHHPVVVAAAGLHPRQVLTSEAFARALRRVQALPVATSARMQYEPLEGGLARVDVSLNERDPYPNGWMALAVIGARAAVGHELKVDAAGLFGAAERISVSGRWQEERPRVAVTLMAPSPSWLKLPGVASFDAMWDRQSYLPAVTRSAEVGPTERETRRRMAVQLTDWSTSWFRWKAGVALDRFDARRFVSLEGGVDIRTARDRIALVASGTEWRPTAGSGRFGTRALLVAGRSTDDVTRGVWSAVTEMSVASSTAPLAVWEGAGTGTARAGLLRAHPLLDEGVLTGEVFGRRVTRGTLEYARPVRRTVVGSISIAAFVDVAQAAQRLTSPRSPLFVDAGAGVRVRMPGRAEVVRIDVAQGLRGGGAAVSVGWLAPWPK